MSNSELVSIIITTYDTLNLDRAIKSVLNQTYKNIEIIVVDDNNSDSEGRNKTEKIMKVYESYKNIIYIKHTTNKNGAAARNTGISKAKGKYVCFLDDDDYYLPTRIEKSILFLKNNKKYDGVLTSVLYYNSQQMKFFNELTSKKSGSLQFELFTNNNILGTGSNIFIKKACFDKIIGFDTDFERFQDIEFMIRFFDYYEIGSIDDYLIVKDVKIQKRNPNFLKKKKAVNLFIKKFSNKIEEMNEENKKKVFYSLYHLLYFSATTNEEIAEVKKEIIKYGNIKIKDIIKKNILKCIPYNQLPRKDKLEVYSKKMDKIDYEYAKRYSIIRGEQS